MSPTSSSTKSHEKDQYRSVSSAAAAPLVPAFATAVHLDDSATNLEEDVVGDVSLERQATPSSPTVHESGVLANRSK